MAVIAGLLHIIFLGFVLGCGGVVWLYAIYTKRRMREAARMGAATAAGGSLLRWFGGSVVQALVRVALRAWRTC